MGNRNNRVGNRPRGGMAASGVALACVFLLSLGGATAANHNDGVRTPKGHFKVERPADLFPNTAETIYQNIRVEMASGYALARLDNVRRYLTWRRFNKAPYRSATHGARYVNNYSNRVGESYGLFENAGPMPPGTVLLKDSFTATADGAIFPGPMFVMEKMADGFNRASGNWRYTMVMPDGSLFGETNGVSSDNVAFCIGCHAMRAEWDHLFFVPADYRRKSFETGQ